MRWTPAAAADLQSISDYLEARHPRYRESTMRKLYKAQSAISSAGRGAADLAARTVQKRSSLSAFDRVNKQIVEVVRIYPDRRIVRLKKL